MKQQEVLKKIGGIIKELTDQYEYLTAAEENLNDLELELFVANAHFLSDHTEILRKINTQSTVAALPPPLPEPDEKKDAFRFGENFFVPIVQQVKPVDKLVEEPEIKEPEHSRQVELEVVNETSAPQIDLPLRGTDDEFSYVRQNEPETIRHDLTLDEAGIWEDKEENEVEKVKDELAKSVEQPHSEPLAISSPIPEKTIELPVIKEEKSAIILQPEPKGILTEEMPLTVNQRMSAQLSGQNGNTATHLHTQPITDLKAAISLNDKLLFIKELFNGYNLAYSEVIDILNRFTSFEEAERYLKANYVVKNNWESKPATADRFYTLLKRKYVN